MTLTALDHWLALGHLTQAQHAALSQWRDDGGGIRKRGRAPKPDRRDEKPALDIMAEAARERHRTAWRAVERLGDNVAKAVHRLVMLDDGDQRVELVARGASVVWCWYRA